MPRLPTERRSEQVIAMVTPTEKAEIERVADQLEMSLSSAARYLLRLGVAEHDQLGGTDAN
jgi:hypothetical protein